jgi:hypothetical protein
MLISESESEFSSYALARSVDIHAPQSIRRIVEIWLTFFSEVHASDTTTAEGDWPDALLFEWGYREALPGYYEQCFYINLTRQFISCDGGDDDAMFQLCWQAEYAPTEAQAFQSFKESVLQSPVLATIGPLGPQKIVYFFTGI